MLADQDIQVLFMFEHAVDKLLSECSHVLRRVILVPELVQPDARLAVNIVLKEDLQRSLARLVARPHS